MRECKATFTVSNFMLSSNVLSVKVHCKWNCNFTEIIFELAGAEYLFSDRYILFKTSTGVLKAQSGSSPCPQSVAWANVKLVPGIIYWSRRQTAGCRSSLRLGTTFLDSVKSDETQVLHSKCVSFRDALMSKITAELPAPLTRTVSFWRQRFVESQTFQ